MEWARSNRGIQLEDSEVKPSGENNGTDNAKLYSCILHPSGNQHLSSL